MLWNRSSIWIVVVLFAAPFVVYLSPQLLGSDAFVVESDSMNPSFSEGDILYVESVSGRDLEKGDVIVFEPSEWGSEELVAHRVVDTRMNNQTMVYKTKGDNNMAADPGWISEDEIIGERVYSFPFIGKLVSGAHSLYFVILLVLLPSTVLIKSEIEKILVERS